jgi:hypothetical protein
MDEAFRQEGAFMVRDGIARQRGMKANCSKRVCFMSSDRGLLEQMMLTVAHSNDCIEVKIGNTAREGVYIGQCILTNDSSVGDLWAKYESHPKVWTTIHDDGFCEAYRGGIRNYHP